MSLQAIGGDSTNVNIGWKGGAIVHLELSLRHLMIELDGKTVNNNKFTGAVGKCIPTVLGLQAVEDIPPIDINIILFLWYTKY